MKVNVHAEGRQRLVLIHLAPGPPSCPDQHKSVVVHERLEGLQPTGARESPWFGSGWFGFPCRGIGRTLILLSSTNLHSLYIHIPYDIIQQCIATRSIHIKCYVQQSKSCCLRSSGELPGTGCLCTDQLIHDPRGGNPSLDRHHSMFID